MSATITAWLRKNWQWCIGLLIMAAVSVGGYVLDLERRVTTLEAYTTGIVQQLIERQRMEGE